MNITEVLQIVDQLVLKHTGKHLNDLQKNVIVGIWQSQTYQEIAHNFGYESENHIGNVSRNLYEILAKELGETVNKSNFCWSIERLANSFYSSQIFGIAINSNFNSCPNNHHQKSEFNNQEKSEEKKPYYNLKQAPRLMKYYGRNKEIKVLSQQLKNPNLNLISVLGITGIGKTNLVRNLVQINQESFDLIVWKNLKFGQSLNSIIREISEIKKSGISEIPDFCSFFDILTDKKCLIILDSFEEIFTPQELAGNYKTEYQDYKKFLQMITEIEHQSCIILISQEKCQEMTSLNSQFSYCLELSGLNESANKILKQHTLKNEDRWLELINLYEGNPQFLQDISLFIKDIFNGNVEKFLQENCLVLTEEMIFVFNSIWLKLSEIERLILLEICYHHDFISIDDIQENLAFSLMELGRGIKSLNQRYLLILKEGDPRLFNLTSVLKEFVKNKGKLLPIKPI